MKALKMTEGGDRLELFLYKDDVDKKNCVMFEIFEDGLKTVYCVKNKDKLQNIFHWLADAINKLS